MEVETCSNRSEIIELITKYGIGYRPCDDPLFVECNKFEQPMKKLGIYSVLAEEDFHIKNAVTCNVPNCLKRFDTIFGYESHYNVCHRYLCNECHKNLPSAHLLDLHLSEKHDSFFAVQSKTKPMFACYLEECKVVCMSPQERKDHCITAHKYPVNFRFDLMPKKGSKETTSQSTHPVIAFESPEVEGTTESTCASTKSQKLLKTINFGHGQPKTFTSDTSYAKVLTKNKSRAKKGSTVLDDNKMIVDLMSSLPD